MSPRTTVNEAADSRSEITSIVHDLRNPLSTIHGGAEILMGSKLLEPQLRRVARNLYSAAVRVKELLDEFLGRCTGTDKARNPYRVSELVTIAVDKISLLAESQAVEIVHQISPNLLVAVDPLRIQRVLVNLFVNALEAMPNGGTIRVSAVGERESVLIKVRDTGPGIAPEIRERLFEPFATSGKSGGLGLGLALSRQAVCDHGGQMWVEFADHGACFAVRLPAIADACPVLC